MSSDGKPVLVTGGAGYIGSHTCKALAAAGYTPITYDSLCRGNAWAVRYGPLEVGDLIDAERLRDVIRKHEPIGVIHFAAFSYVGESMDDPLPYYLNNVGGTATLLRAMQVEGGSRASPSHPPARPTARPSVFGDDHDTADGTCIRANIHVTDLADAHVAALARTGSGPGFDAFNLGTGTGVSVREVIEMAREITGRDVPHVYGARRAGDPAALVADPSRALAALNWKASRSDLRNILLTASAWMDRS